MLVGWKSKQLNEILSEPKRKKNAFSSIKVERPIILKATHAGKMPVCQPQEKMGRKMKVLKKV